MWGIISAVALLHRLRYWLRKLLRLLRLRRSAERVSSTARVVPPAHARFSVLHFIHHQPEEVWEESSLEQDHALWRVNSAVSSSENR